MFSLNSFQPRASIDFFFFSKATKYEVDPVNNPEILTSYHLVASLGRSLAFGKGCSGLWLFNMAVSFPFLLILCREDCTVSNHLDFKVARKIYLEIPWMYSVSSAYA